MTNLSDAVERVKGYEPLWDGWRCTGRLLGSGASGCVLELERGDERSVVKVITVEDSSDKYALVKNEIETMTHLRNKYLAECLDYRVEQIFNRRGELAKWVDLINAEKPDMVLIGGDVIDNSIRPLAEEKMAEEFHRINAPIYACLGNHEYYSSEPRARQFYKQAGIHLLVDSTVVIDSALCIIGCDDRTNPNRKELASLAATVDPSLYTIVLVHQPHELEKTEQSKADFQFSGHTHRGQVWPISWITDAIYECSWGEYQRGDTRFYVSSGLGLWGGKFRIGTQSEYVVARLKN